MDRTGALSIISSFWAAHWIYQAEGEYRAGFYLSD